MLFANDFNDYLSYSFPLNTKEIEPLLSSFEDFSENNPNNEISQNNQNNEIAQNNQNNEITQNKQNSPNNEIAQINQNSPNDGVTQNSQNGENHPSIICINEIDKELLNIKSDHLEIKIKELTSQNVDKKRKSKVFSRKIKRGNFEAKEKKHNKYAKDNMLKKTKIRFVKTCISFINSIIKNDINLYSYLGSQLLLEIDTKNLINSNIQYNKDLLKKN